MSIPVEHDNTGSVNINNINNEPMLKIVNKGNGKVDLNSASDKNALSIDANGVVSASNLTTSNLTTSNLTTSNLTLLQPNLNIPANATIGGTTTLNGTLTANSTTTLNGVLDANSTVDIADTLTLSKASGDGLSVTANATVGGALAVNGLSVTANATVGGVLAVTGTATAQSFHINGNQVVGAQSAHIASPSVDINSAYNGTDVSELLIELNNLRVAVKESQATITQLLIQLRNHGLIASS